MACSAVYCTGTVPFVKNRNVVGKDVRHVTFDEKSVKEQRWLNYARGFTAALPHKSSSNTKVHNIKNILMPDVLLVTSQLDMNSF